MLNSPDELPSWELRSSRKDQRSQVSGVHLLENTMQQSFRGARVASGPLHILIPATCRTDCVISSRWKLKAQGTHWLLSNYQLPVSSVSCRHTIC